VSGPVTSSIGWTGLAASLVLVAVAIGLSWWQGLRLERSMVWAVARGGAQLLLVGVALRVVLDPQAPLALAWSWVAAMVVFTSWTVGRRAPEAPGIVPVSMVASAAVAVVSLAVIFGLQIFPLEARTLVPLAGMMIGNSLTATVVVARRVIGEVTDKRLEIEARLALGQASRDAARPYVRDAMRTALIPQIESTKAVGLVFLPGAMTGLILAGADPAQAVQVQVAIMYLILGSVATSVTVVALGLTRSLFTPDHRLVRLRRRPS